MTKSYKGLAAFSFIILFLSMFLIMSGLIGLIVKSIKPFIECTELGIDAKGKKYLVANDESWFFGNLTLRDKEAIKEIIVGLEKWRDETLSKINNEKKRAKFIDKYNRKSQKAFYCYIYRSGTRYTQSNYVKTPYIGTSEYWGNYYSIDYMKRKIN